MKLDQDELALRMLEAAVGVRRPAGLTAKQAFAAGPSVLQASYQRASVAAIQYFIECAGPLTILPEPVEHADPSREKVRKTNGYPVILGGDHAAYELEHANTPPQERSDWPLPSFDARDWAAAFCKIAKTHGHGLDEGWMTTWFANALMRGFDEAAIGDGHKTGD